VDRDPVAVRALRVVAARDLSVLLGDLAAVDVPPSGNPAAIESDE
jgi:hypothetical protein